MTIKIPSKFKFDKDTLACIGLFFFLIKKVVMTALLYLFHTPQIFNTWMAIVLMYIPIIMIPFVRGKKRKIDGFIFIWILVVMICMITYLFHPEYEEWLFKGEFKVWTYIFMPDKAIYLVLFLLLVREPQKIYSTLKYAGFVLIIYNVFKLVYAEFVRGYWVTTGITRGGEGEYNLGFGYDILFLFVLFIELYRKEKKKYYLLFSGISLVCILIAGSRGPLLGVALILLIQFWDKVRNLSIQKRAIVVSLFGALLVFVVVNISNIMIMIGLLLQRFGISSRTVMLFASGNYNYDSGRSVLWGIAIELIRTGGPFGYGMYGDRYVIASQTSMWIGYCHEIALEILVDFGYLLGGFILAILIYRIIKNLRSPESEWRSIYLIFLISASQLILSGSFWYISTFWGAIAIDMCWSEQFRRNRLVITSTKRLVP